MDDVDTSCSVVHQSAVDTATIKGQSDALRKPAPTQSDAPDDCAGGACPIK